MRHGKRWRILAHGDEQSVDLYSPEYIAECKKRDKLHGRETTFYDDKPVTPKGTVFDELVIDDFLHLEQMDHNRWWMRVGDVCINVTIRRNGSVAVSVERGVYGPVVDSSEK